MSAAQRTRLYLDVDGVINAQMPMDWGKLCNGHAGGYSIRWAPRMVAELADLNVELVWTTTWRDEAVTELAPLIGWGEHGRVLHPAGGELIWPSIDWKFEAVLADQAASPSSFIWLDDELEAEHKRHGGLVLTVPAALGITPRIMDMMRDWIAV